MNSKIIIMTHAGLFPPTDVVASMIISSLFPNYLLVRTQNPQKHSEARFWIGIGESYDPKTGHYDHHLKNFSLKYNEKDHRSTTFLSPTGLIFKDYGRQFVSTLGNLEKIYENNEQKIKEVVDNIYYQFFQEIDLDSYSFPQVKNQSPTSLPAILNRMNGIDTSDETKQIELFVKAMEMAKQILSVLIKNVLDTDAQAKVEYNHFEAELKHRTSPDFAVLSQKYTTWRQCLKSYEQINKQDHIKFLIRTHSPKEWRIHALQDRPKKFRSLLADPNRIIKSIPNQRGVIFVHQDRYFASTKDLETAKKLVEISLI